MPTGSNNPLGKVRPGYATGDLLVIRQATTDDFAVYPLKKMGSDTQIRYWLVECKCGGRFIASTTRMHCKNTKSCGCRRYRDMPRPVTSKTDPVDMVRRNCFTRSRAGAKRRGLDWELDYKTFCRITSYPCSYCNCPPSNTHNPTSHHRRGGIEPQPFIYNGIDRVDSNLGYIYGNCIASCKRCNVAKSDMTTLEFYQWLNRVKSNEEPVLIGVDAHFNWDNCAASSG